MQPESAEAKKFLEQWQLARLAEPLPDGLRTGPASVTVLAYHFWPAELSDDRFKFVECSIRETWRHCGMLKTVLVCNAECTAASEFKNRFPGWVAIQIEPNLIPGKIDSMSADCNGMLADRFDTDYVLIVQEDGFPLRSGLEAFLGKWDFIGAPYVRDRFLQNLFCRCFGCWVSNGGFSLRSKRICEEAADFWRKKYSKWPDLHAVTEDLYYTKFLPLREASYRRVFRIADNRTAVTFAVDDIVPCTIRAKPFGFHRAETFAGLMK